MEINVIRSQEQYRTYLSVAEQLVARDPEPDSNDGERLALLSLLIEDFEKRQFDFAKPDPIEAIEFRMEEQGLRQKDLVPLIGTRARVSEILSRKRPLSVQMIRSLSRGLGISTDILLGDEQMVSEAAENHLEETPVKWDLFPFAEMKKRGWFESIARTEKIDILTSYFHQAAGAQPMHAFFRRKLRGDFKAGSQYSVMAWCAKVLIESRTEFPRLGKFELSEINEEFLRGIGHLSWYDKGPLLAKEELASKGIALVVVDHLPSTLVDGAVMISSEGYPVIGMTLRHDRLDYFWFTLLHELVHLWRHLDRPGEAFVDRLEAFDSDDVVEREANHLAKEALIPRSVWKRSSAFLSPSRENILLLASKVHVSPAVVVGRLQFETGRYDLFRDLLGQGSVKKQFAQ